MATRTHHWVNKMLRATKMEGGEWHCEEEIKMKKIHLEAVFLLEKHGQKFKTLLPIQKDQFDTTRLLFILQKPHLCFWKPIAQRANCTAQTKKFPLYQKRGTPTAGYCLAHNGWHGPSQVAGSQKGKSQINIIRTIHELLQYMNIFIYIYTYIQTYIYMAGGK